MPTVRYTTVNGEVLAEKRGGVRRFYVPDPLGSTVALLDNSQAQTDTFTYWPYGVERAMSGMAMPESIVCPKCGQRIHLQENALLGPAPSTEPRRCILCLRNVKEVGRAFAGRDASICVDCIRQCNSMLNEVDGKDSPG